MRHCIIIPVTLCLTEKNKKEQSWANSCAYKYVSYTRVLVDGIKIFVEFTSFFLSTGPAGLGSSNASVILSDQDARLSSDKGWKHSGYQTANQLL